jgi:hypothetical protein
MEWRSEKSVTILAHEYKGLAGKFCAGDFMPAEEKCVEVLMGLRWEKGVECPYCPSKDAVKNGKWGSVRDTCARPASATSTT